MDRMRVLLFDAGVAREAIMRQLWPADEPPLVDIQHAGSLAEISSLLRTACFDCILRTAGLGSAAVAGLNRLIDSLPAGYRPPTLVVDDHFPRPAARVEVPAADSHIACSELSAEVVAEFVRRHRQMVPAAPAETVITMSEGASQAPRRDEGHAAVLRLHETVAQQIADDSPQFLMEAIADAAIAVSGAPRACVQFCDTGGRMLPLIAQRGFADHLARRSASFREGIGACNEVLRLRTRLLVDDVSGHPGLANTRAAIAVARAGVRAMQSTPLLARDGRLLGLFATHWSQPCLPHGETLEMLDVLARHAGDLIEQWHRERALRKADQRKNEFMAMLGHELRNPLTPIVLVLGAIKRHDNDPFTKEHRTIEQQVRHMLRLVDDLLDISRIARGGLHLQKSRVFLPDALTQAVQMAMPLVEKRRHRLSIDVARIYLEADAARLTQIVANLLTNAARYTPAGGRIRLRARRSGDTVVLTVRDNGIGIADEYLPEVFDLFSQAVPSDTIKGGLGLGLAIVKHLVALHHGTVEAASAGPGKGAVFTVRLPTGEREEIPAPPATSGGEGTAAFRPRRILLVDDNEDVLEWMPSLLRRLGHSVSTAKCGEEALSALKINRPEIAVLDLGLPDMSGYELATRIRSLFGAAAPQLIALTGFGQDSDRSRSRAAGFVAHVTKPHLDGLLEAIESCSAVTTTPHPAGDAQTIQHLVSPEGA